MAKAKSKKITIEDALVPVEEQPYEVPENWCWITIEHAYEVTSSKRVHKSDWKDIGIPFYRTRELVKLSEQGYVDNELFITEELYDDIVTEYGKPNEGDILVSGVGTIGIPCVVPANKEFYFKDGNVIWLKNRGIFDSKYIFYLYKSLFMHNQIYGMSAGTTVDTYTIVNANKTKVPLPPPPEQQRIVEQIESLFSKLDEAKDKAQRVLDFVEDRRLSILNAAYSGRLTTNWRNGAEASFKTMLLSEICTKITDGFHNSPKPVDEGYPYVMAGCVKEQGIDYYNGLYMDEKNHRELYNKAHPEKGDILMVNIGAGSGTAAVIDVDFEFSFKNSAILKLKKDMVNPYYVLYYLWLRKKYLLIEVTRGGAQPFLSLKIINNISIPICSLDEQYEIVKIVDSILQIENNIKDKQERVIETADIVKKSILAKAFRGELGTNDPSEESSIELLKQIIANE